MIDTIRVLVDWKCNLKCSYCCNEQEQFRKNIIPTKIEDINWNDYKFVCISGGEPLLFMDRVESVAKKSKGFNILYSNGTIWDKDKAEKLQEWGVNAANIGLHYPASFDKIIEKVAKAAENTKISVRFHIWEKYKDFQLKYPTLSFRLWTINDCDRENERRVVLN